MKVNTNFARYAVSGGTINIMNRWSIVYPNSNSSITLNITEDTGRYIIAVNNTLSSSVTVNIASSEYTTFVICKPHSITWILFDSYEPQAISSIQTITWAKPN